MDIRVLRSFLAVAREENITRATESLHISQPSLSKQIMELEKELGKQLIIRGKRKITLTEEGLLLKKRANEIVALMELTEREISSDSKSIHGDVSIGGGTFRTIMKSVSDLQNKYPDVRFHFIVGDAEDTMEKIDHGILDFAILPEPIDTTKYDFLSLPVVDRENRMVGIVTFDDAMDVIEEETTEDFSKMAAVAPSDDSYFKTSVFTHAKNRIAWLLILMLSISTILKSPLMTCCRKWRRTSVNVANRTSPTVRCMIKFSQKGAKMCIRDSAPSTPKN